MRHSGSAGKFSTTRVWGARTAAICAVVSAALWTVSPPAKATVSPGRIVSLIPSDDEVSQYVGLPVVHLSDPVPVRPRDPDHLNQRDDCRVLLYINTVDVWGTDYSSFRGQSWAYQQDPGRMFVSQAVGTFASARDARNRYDAVYNPNLFNSCNHADLHGPPLVDGVDVELYTFDIDANFVLWGLADKYQGQYTGYNEVAVVWQLDNVMSVVSVYQEGNPAQAVARLAAHTLHRIG